MRCAVPDPSTQSSEFAGQVLRVDGGEGIFLDVELLSQVLNPIMDHKLRLRKFPATREIKWRNDLLNTGVLRWKFARFLWREIFFSHAAQSSEGQLEEALFDVLVKLGVGLPLGRATTVPPNGSSALSASRQATTVPANGGMRSALPASSEGNGMRDMLVWRWLPLSLTEELREHLEDLLEKKRQSGAREVTLKWEFDSAGAPHGLVGRVMALCHVVGEAETGLCWRSGAVFKSPRVTEWAVKSPRVAGGVVKSARGTGGAVGSPRVAGGVAKSARVTGEAVDSPRVAGGADRPYIVAIHYDDTKRVFSVRMFGHLESERMWVALRFIASVMVNIAVEWPGVLWEGWLECAEHVRDRVHLTTPSEVCSVPTSLSQLTARCSYIYMASSFTRIAYTSYLPSVQVPMP